MTQQPTDVQARRARRDRPADAAGRRRRSGRASSPRSAPSPASRSRSTRTPTAATSTTSTSATTARPPSSCCPTARTRRSPTRSTWPSSPRWPACTSTRSASAAPQGPSSRSTASSVATALDEDVLTQIASVTGGTYFNARGRRRRWPRSTSSIDLQVTTEPKKTEVTAVRHRRQHRCCSSSGARCRSLWFGRVGVAMSFWTPQALLLAPAGAAAARRLPLAAAPQAQAGRALLERRAHPRRASPAARAGAGTSRWRCSWRASRRWPSPRRVRRCRVEVPLSRTSIILALDVSRSMCATDVAAEPAGRGPGGGASVRQGPGRGHAHRHRRLRRLRRAGRAAHHRQGAS